MPKGQYQRKQKEFICNRCKRTYLALCQKKNKGLCFKCRNIMKVYRKRERIPGLYIKYNHRIRLKKLAEVGGNCEICKTPVAYNHETRKFNTRFIIHHVCYSPEVKVLLCFSCHRWLHGSGAAYNHPFKKLYDKDIAVFEFISRAYDIYLQHHPSMQEIIRVDARTLQEVKDGLALNEDRAEEV